MKTQGTTSSLWKASIADAGKYLFCSRAGLVRLLICEIALMLGGAALLLLFPDVLGAAGVTLRRFKWAVYNAAILIPVVTFGVLSVATFFDLREEARRN